MLDDFYWNSVVGKLSRENNGGFASCRTEISVGDLNGYHGLQIHVSEPLTLNITLTGLK